MQRGRDAGRNSENGRSGKSIDILHLSKTTDTSVKKKYHGKSKSDSTDSTPILKHK